MPKAKQTQAAVTALDAARYLRDACDLPEATGRDGEVTVEGTPEEWLRYLAAAVRAAGFGAGG